MSDIQHCPLAGECKFIDDLWLEIRYIKKKQEEEIRCIKKREGDFISMGWFKILLGVLIILFGGIMTLGWSIKDDISSIDKVQAVNSQRMKTIEEQLKQHVINNSPQQNDQDRRRFR